MWWFTFVCFFCKGDYGTDYVHRSGVFWALWYWCRLLPRPPPSPVSVYPDTTQPCSLSIAGKQLAIMNSNPSFLFCFWVSYMEFGTLVWFFGGFLPFPNQQDAILDGDPSAPWGSDSMRFDSDFECSRKLSKSRVGGGRDESFVTAARTATAAPRRRGRGRRRLFFWFETRRAL